MDYHFNTIETKWQKYWSEHQSFKAEENKEKEKFYVLDMFPYPSGAGLHVGHPLGYIASDIIARYQRHLGKNVLHPAGYDAFGLPAEQYAIQTGQHPAITTETNIQRYRQQLDQLGFSFDWSREVRTSNPDYYRWTQWIFMQLFQSWYNVSTDKAEDIKDLEATFASEGNANIQACTTYEDSFTAEEWKNFSAEQKNEVLSHYRLAYLAESTVNWCPALGTVLANDEVKEGLSERGGHPVVQKKMMQWSMRITAYAQRLLDGLDTIDWSEAIKETQRNWIGRSQGALVHFALEGLEGTIDVFTTRPDTIFGVSYLCLAPEHELVSEITTEEYADAVKAYQEKSAARSERERMADVKTISGQFTGAYAKHPFTGEPIPVWIGDYVLAGYGTGAVMAVPGHDSRDWAFAKHFQLPIIEVVEGGNLAEEAYEAKTGTLVASDFLNGLEVADAIAKAIEALEKQNKGEGQTNYRLRDAVFGRQRYWGEPIPVYYKDGVPQLVKEEHLPLELPAVDKYLPTEDGEPPLARATEWNYHPEKGVVSKGEGYPLETTTMPGWAGSSWYFLRYMDAKNTAAFVAKEKEAYWGQVDTYFGGSEHATGHLLYARFWHKFLADKGFVSTQEPFKKLINQGMIQGTSAFVYRVKGSNTFVSKGLIKEHEVTPLHVDVNLVENDQLNIEEFKAWRPEFKDAEFILENGQYICGSEVEKMSKSKFNVVTPDSIIEKYGADTLRMYEMFLGPLEQSKPWNTNGISGVHNFLKKLWRLYSIGEQGAQLSEEEPSKESLKTLHKTIKKVREDLDGFVFNTSISTFMICVNELGEQKCKSRAILEPLAILISPFAPHMAEELWQQMGHKGSISNQEYPSFNPSFLVESSHAYPVSFNGKMRFKMDLPLTLSKEEIEKEVLACEQAQKYLEGKSPKKVIVVPKKIVNIVV